MIRGAALLMVVVVVPLLAGCGLMSGGKKEDEASPFGPTGIPPHLRTKLSEDELADAAAAAAAGGGVAVPGGGAPVLEGITPEDQIVWTDPDDPDAEIPELDTLLAEPARGPWEQSDTVARRRAQREGRCVLIWFTDSLRSPTCRTLGNELLGTTEFGDWAEENLVRLRVDAHVKAAVRERNLDDGFDEMDAEARMKDHVAKLKKRYRAFGNPTLVMLSPQGEVIGRYRGYRSGGAEFLWGQLKSALKAGERSYKKWRGRLEKRGYREWADRRGRKVFAKLLAYRDGELLLVEPDGQRARTKEGRLSDGDRLWIEEQKRQAAAGGGSS